MFKQDVVYFYIYFRLHFVDTTKKNHHFYNQKPLQHIIRTIPILYYSVIQINISIKCSVLLYV